MEGRDWMKIKVTCLACESIGTDDDNTYLELTDDNMISSVTCPKGHKQMIVLTPSKFELLFDMGLYALNDGYSREAVSNFAAVVERFHEFSIEVMAKEQENKLVRASDDFDDQFTKVWKEMSRQSERQYGAYILIYLITFRRSPKLLPTKRIEFRNDIIHKGAFPSKSKVIDYGRAIFEYISEKYIELHNRFPDSVNNIKTKELDKEMENIDAYNGGTIVHTNYSNAFFIDKESGELYHSSFDEALETAASLQLLNAEPAK